ncbi:hypothetical protein BKA80DRAFT_109037 [Phyllosticta citrichinensis]
MDSLASFKHGMNCIPYRTLQHLQQHHHHHQGNTENGDRLLGCIVFAWAWREHTCTKYECIHFMPPPPLLLLHHSLLLHYHISLPFPFPQIARSSLGTRGRLGASVGVGNNRPTPTTGPERASLFVRRYLPACIFIWNAKAPNSRAILAGVAGPWCGRQARRLTLRAALAQSFLVVAVRGRR